MDGFWTNLHKLSVNIPMFPHPQDILSAGCKVIRDVDLTIVAARVTNSPYPASVLLKSKKELVEACQNPHLVIKRDFSDSTTCTFMPGPNRTTRVKKRYADTLLDYSDIQTLPQPSWMAQPFNPEVAFKGELRAFVVGGRVQYTVSTWPGAEAGAFDQELVDNYTPLELLK